MSENLNRGTCDYTKYDAMATEELEEILRLDSEAPGGQESDTQKLLHIMEVLADRARQLRTPGKTAQQAWESFQQDYLPAQEDDFEDASEPPKSIKPARPRLRRLIAVAAVIALLIGIPVAAHALGWEEIWNAVAKWTKETFSFVSSGETQHSAPHREDDAQYSSLKHVLSTVDGADQLVPSWIPEGYVLQDITVDERPAQQVYIGRYANGEAKFIIRVQSFLNTDGLNVEISEDPIEIYEVSGTEYYIFSNHDQIRAVWTNGSYECYISGELTIEEIKMMIDSIGKE